MLRTVCLTDGVCRLTRLINHTHIHAHPRTHTHTPTHRNTHKHARTHTHTRTLTHTHIHSHTHTHKHAHTYAHTHKHTHAHTQTLECATCYEGYLRMCYHFWFDNSLPPLQDHDDDLMMPLLQIQFLRRMKVFCVCTFHRRVQTNVPKKCSSSQIHRICGPYSAHFYASAHVNFHTSITSHSFVRISPYMAGI